jgi:NADH-quinone oxidoreductase subunit J
MTADQILFLVFAILGLGLAAASVALRNLVRAAFALIGCLFAVAALYALLEASLFVVAQAAVYVGAIAVLIVLVVMLTRRELREKATQTHRYAPLAAVLAALITAGLAAGLSQFASFDRTMPVLPPDDMVIRLGDALLDPSGFLIPFEAVSVMLLSVLIGAVLVAGGTRPGRGKG